jgi:hypothetical protein
MTENLTQPENPDSEAHPAAQVEPQLSPVDDMTLLSLLRRMSALENEISVLKDRLQRRGIR